MVCLYEKPSFLQAKSPVSVQPHLHYPLFLYPLPYYHFLTYNYSHILQTHINFLSNNESRNLPFGCHWTLKPQSQHLKVDTRLPNNLWFQTGGAEISPRTMTRTPVQFYGHHTISITTTIIIIWLLIIIFLSYSRHCCCIHIMTIIFLNVCSIFIIVNKICSQSLFYFAFDC